MSSSEIMHPNSSFSQVVHPNLSQETEAGWCLKFTQDAFGAPRMYTSATEAANATKFRSASRDMPNVSVPVWFDHWGTYQGRYNNWGHVVLWVPGGGFLSSPTSGFGQLWLPSIESVERTFGAKFRFWTLDINTLLVAETRKEEDEMAVEDIHVEFKKLDSQHVKVGETVNLHINDDKHVSVARGAAKHVSGNLAIRLSGGEPYKGAVQVTPIVRTVVDGKPDKITSLRAREIVFTGGDTFGDIAVNCALKVGQRLSFRVGASTHEFVVKSAVFRGMKIT